MIQVFVLKGQSVNLTAECTYMQNYTVGWLIMLEVFLVLLFNLVKYWMLQAKVSASRSD